MGDDEDVRDLICPECGSPQVAYAEANDTWKCQNLACDHEWPRR